MDEASTVWGYYGYLPSYRDLIKYLIFAIVVTTSCLVFTFFFIRKRIISSLDHELYPFSSFLTEIDRLASDIAAQSSARDLSEVSRESHRDFTLEERKIHTAVERLMTEISLSQEEVIRLTREAESRRLDEELGKLASQDG